MVSCLPNGEQLGGPEAARSTIGASVIETSDENSGGLRHGRALIPLYAEANSTSNSFRVRRFRLIHAMIDGIIAEKGSCRILDLGGMPVFWEQFGAELDWDKLQVCVLNLDSWPTTNPR